MKFQEGSYKKLQNKQNEKDVNLKKKLVLNDQTVKVNIQIDRNKIDGRTLFAVILEIVNRDYFVRSGDTFSILDSKSIYSKLETFFKFINNSGKLNEHLASGFSALFNQ